MRPSVAKAASYRPIDIPSPSASQVSPSITGPLAGASSTKPTAKVTLEIANTLWPPTASMRRPIRGLRKPEISSEAEKAAENHCVDTTVSRAMTSPSTVETSRPRRN